MYTLPSLGQGLFLSADTDCDRCLSLNVVFVRPSVVQIRRSVIYTLPFAPAVVPWRSVGAEIAQEQPVVNMGLHDMAACKHTYTYRLVHERKPNPTFDHYTGTITLSSVLSVHTQEEALHDLRAHVLRIYNT